MTISEQTITTLEFPKIREQLAQYTAFSASRTLALSLLPHTDPLAVVRCQQLTGEARQLLDALPDTSIGGARDIRNAVSHAARGGVLEASTFLEIASTLASMRHLRDTLFKLNPDDFPRLREYAGDLPQLLTLEEEIARTIGDDGLVLDSASPALARIRSDVRIAFSRLHERLQGLLHSSQVAPALQEPIITVRNGRYVLPIKAGQRRAVPGLVHDQSASGATLYIEPLATLELNNRWRELQLAEEEEVARILAALSGQVGAVADTIVTGVSTLAHLDLAFAQARYAVTLRGVQPELVSSCAVHAGTQPLVHLRQARHPLLDPATVVPIDVWLGGEFQLLLITGPNTGGKTVALKTVGLLALMAQAGLHIPAAAPARLPVFDQIFADIGDEQSIEQSLSTFSSHMTNIIRILHAIDEPGSDWREPARSDEHRVLVLLDELGAGTDPVEGAALARVIVGRLLERGCLGIATTHYAELKAFASNTPGVQNASVEFDLESLAPTYRLMIGVPGRSNALAIAARLGLDPELVEQARRTMSTVETQVEDLLATIHREREVAAYELHRAEELRADAQKYRDRLADELQEFATTRQERLAAMQQAVEDDLRETRAELRRLRADLRSASLSRQWIAAAEQRIQIMQTEVQQTVQRAGRDAQSPSTVQPVIGEPPWKVGDTVLVRSVGLTGEIVAIDADEQAADVQVGGFRVHVALDELRRAKRNATEERRQQYMTSPSVSLPAVPDVGMNLDIRGWRAAEAVEKLDRYLNNAYLSGLGQVRIIHGKGTGALRHAVRDMLAGHPLVLSFGSGGVDGGDGVTVVHLVER